MPALVAGIHVFAVSAVSKSGDGRDEPGHDRHFPFVYLSFWFARLTQFAPGS